MRPAKARQLSVPSNHHMKKNRRCSNGASHVDTYLRITSIVVIVFAFCEFSGISQSFLDAYNSSFIPYAELSKDEGSNRVDSDAAGSKNKHNSLSTSTHASRVTFPLRQRASLKNLYSGFSPSATMADVIEQRKTLETKGPKVSPSFQLEMHWTKENFDDKVCRIHNACMRSDGALLVHKWMKSQESHLRSCGVQNLQYMKSEKDFNQDDINSNVDLFGTRPARYHIPHFLTDILPLIYASELLRPVFTTPSNIQSVCEAPGKRRCHKLSISEKLNPSLYAEQRIAAMELSSWVPQLSAMLPGKPSMHFIDSMFNNTRGPACFRSVVAFNHNKFVRRGTEWFGRSNPMFSSHGIQRGSVREGSSNVAKKEAWACKRRVTILNRVGWAKRGDFLLGRDVVNVEQVVDQVEQESRSKGNENLKLRVNIEYFENMSFPEQVEVMQKADVLMGVHGAGLANMVFARQDVPLLEVLPFGYYAGPFNTLARALYLDYSNTIAEPDSENFADCLRTWADKLHDPAVVKKGMKMWSEAVRKREQGNWYALQTHRFTSRELVPVKLCARSQRLRVDAVEVGRKLVEMAQRVCGRGQERAK